MNVDKNELLTILMEEAAEVIVECSKIIRFENDDQALSKELGDLLAMIELAVTADIIDTSVVNRQISKKYQKLRTYSKGLHEVLNNVDKHHIIE